MSFWKSRRFLSATTVLIVVCMLYLIGRNIVIRQGFAAWSGSFCFIFLSAVFSVTILFSYDSHDTNTMKPAIGMLLGVNTYQSINAFVSNICVPEVLETYLSAGASGYASLVLDVLDFILTVGFCVNHLLISSGHHSSKPNVKLNLFLCLALSVEYVIQVLLCIAIFPPEKVVYNAVFYLLAIGDILVILWVEMKLDYFRTEREKRAQATLT